MTGLIIFSRLDSSRLPGKALLPIGDRPLLGRVVDRARRVRLIDRIVLATSDRACDDPLAAFAAAEGIGCFRGDVDDVAGRALAAARAFGLTAFARVCGDRAFFDPGLVDALIALQRAEGLDLATNATGQTYAPGLTAEVIRTEALAAALAATDDPEDREHVTRWFYRHPDRVRMTNRPAPDDSLAGTRLVVDTDQDLARARFIAARLGERTNVATAAEVVALAKTWDKDNLR